MRRCHFYIIEYAEEGIADVSYPFMVLMSCNDRENGFVRSVVLSEWKKRLHIRDRSTSRYIGDFIAEARTLNHVTPDERLAFMAIVDGLCAGVLRTTSDGTCDISDIMQADPLTEWDAEQVGCSPDIFHTVIAQLTSATTAGT